MMKILHVSQRYWPSVGGSEQYIQEVSERLVEHGHDVTVFTTDALDMEAFWDPSKSRAAPSTETHRGVLIRRFPVRYIAGGRIGFDATRRIMAQVSRLPGVARPVLCRLAPFAPWVPALARAISGVARDFDVIHGTNVGSDALLVPLAEATRRSGTPFILTPLVHLGASAASVVRAHYTMPHQLDLILDASAVLALT